MNLHAILPLDAAGVAFQTNGFGPECAPHLDAFDDEHDLELASEVNCALDDCFFSLGQAIASQKELDSDALVWLLSRYRAKFLRSMKTLGNQWAEDRARVKGVARMLGERAVYYAGDNPRIDRACAERASADVEKYCMRHAERRAARSGLSDQDAAAMYAGYWCSPDGLA